MKVEDRHRDILQNIEFVVAEYYRGNSELTDPSILRVYSALREHYRALSKKHTKPDISHLDELETTIFEAVEGILETRKDDLETETEEKAPAPSTGRRRFSSVLRSKSQPESLDKIYVSCFSRLMKSADHWYKERGLQGYLNFMSHYV